MDRQPELIFLIDKAIEIAGGPAKLARLINAKPQHIPNWKAGTRRCSPEDQALLAAIAGYDAEQTLIRATVQYWEGKPKGDLLMRVLGKASRATGAVLGFVGASALGAYSILTFSQPQIQCIDR